MTRTKQTAPTTIKKNYVPQPSSNSGSTFVSSMAGSIAGTYIGNKILHNSSDNYNDTIKLETKKCLETNQYDYNQCKKYIDEMVGLK